MKTCPVCGATYSSRISFCFEDGAVLLAQAAAGEHAAGAAPARHVPSRVATPVAPARRGRSLLAQKGGGLTFSPPRATATPAGVPAQGPDLSPAPLEPLDLPVAERDDLLADLPVPTLATPLAAGTPTPPAAPMAAPPTPNPYTPTPPAPPRGPAVVPDDVDARTYDDLDFPDVAQDLAGPDLGVGPDFPADEDWEEPAEERRGVPLWWYAAGAAAVLVVVLLVVFVGGFAGLLGAGALTRAPEPEPPAVVAVAPAPVPAPEPVIEVVPPAPEVEVPPAPEPEVAAVEPAPEPVPEAAPSPAPVPAPVVVPAPVAAPAPAVAPSDASPWGTLDVQQGTLSINSVPAGAKVVVDGIARGATPARITLPYGDHDVKVSLDGYTDGAQSVRLDAAQAAITLTLQPAARTGSFIVVLEGSVGAMLYVDGVKAGPLPARVTLSEGPHQFTVESPSGSYTVTREVSLGGGSNVINLAG